METLAQFVATFLTVYMLCIFVWALISWLPMLSPGLAYNSTVVSIRKFLDSIVEPYVGIFRKFIPPVNMGGAMLDLSAIVAIVVLMIASRTLPQLIYNLG